MKQKSLVANSILIFSIITLILSVITGGNNHLISANFETEITHNSSILIEYNSEKILIDNNSNERFPIASVTKLMTILLTLEEISEGNISLSDQVFVSENASGMGGSQIFLDSNKEYQLSQLLKSVIISSANDSSVALAEYISGSEQNFVKKMNERANELNLKNTHYSNCTGLPTNNGYSSAYDQAIILKHVLDFDIYHGFSSIWMEDFVHPSGRITQMTNTNKLSKFYEGCIGGKTGSTNQAKYCLAVGAERNNSKYISVVLGANNSAERFKLASDMLNFGFANFENKTLLSNHDLLDKKVEINNSSEKINLKCEKEFYLTTKKNEPLNYSLNFHLPTKLKSVETNQIVGTVDIVVDGIIIETINILSCNIFKEPSVWENFKNIINS